VGQTSTSSRPISRITPRIAAKLREKLGYLLGNLYLKGIDPNRLQLRGIEEIASLGQELAQLEKPSNQDRFKRYLGQSHQPKRHKILIRNTHQKPQEIVLKTPPTKSSENQHEEGQENHFSTLRNNAEPSIHTMKVRTRSSLPPIHPSLSLDLS
jgi:hypothetical protein